MWGQNLHDGEPPLSRGRFGRLRPRLLARGLPARDLPRLIFDVHLPNDPFRRLPDESVTVVDAHLRVDHETQMLIVRTIRERCGAYWRRDQ